MRLTKVLAVHDTIRMWLHGLYVATEIKFFHKVLQALADRLRSHATAITLLFPIIQTGPLHNATHATMSSASVWKGSPSPDVEEHLPQYSLVVFLPMLSPWAAYEEMAALGVTTTNAEGCASSLLFQEPFQACHSTNWYSILTDFLYLCVYPNI